MRDFFSFFKPTEEDPGADLGRRLVLTGGLSFVVATMAGCDGNSFSSEFFLDPNERFNKAYRLGDLNKTTDRHKSKSPAEIIAQSATVLHDLKTTASRAQNCSGEQTFLDIMEEAGSYTKVSPAVFLANVHIESSGRCGAIPKDKNGKIETTAVSLMQIVEKTRESLAENEFLALLRKARRLYLDYYPKGHFFDYVNKASEEVSQQQGESYMQYKARYDAKLAELEEKAFKKMAANPNVIAADAKLSLILGGLYLKKVGEYFPVDAPMSWVILGYYAGPGTAKKWYDISQRYGITTPDEMLVKRSIDASFASLLPDPPGDAGWPGVAKHLNGFNKAYLVAAALQEENFASLRTSVPNMRQQMDTAVRTAQVQTQTTPTIQSPQYPARAVVQPREPSSGGSSAYGGSRFRGMCSDQVPPAELNNLKVLFGKANDGRNCYVVRN